MLVIVLVLLVLAPVPAIIFFQHRKIKNLHVLLHPSPLKILTPLDNPWGSLSELIEWAEARAVREHRQAYSDPITEELERRFREAVRTEKATVLEDMHFTTINEKREAAGYIRMESSRYGRYIDDIGYVTADSPELLNRACEVVLTRHWDNKARGVLHAIEALNNQTLGQLCYNGIARPHITRRGTTMASIDTMIFDKDAYLPGDLITLTVGYTPDAPGVLPNTFTATETISDAGGNVLATNSAPFVVNETAPSGDHLDDPTDTGNRTWTRVSDDGSTGVFTATA
jgi:hypothetical protein